MCDAVSMKQGGEASGLLFRKTCGFFSMKFDAEMTITKAQNI